MFIVLQSKGGDDILLNVNIIHTNVIYREKKVTAFHHNQIHGMALVMSSKYSKSIKKKLLESSDN